jgi:hypothetical protein
VEGAYKVLRHGGASDLVHAGETSRLVPRLWRYAHWLFVSNSEQFHILNLDVETGYVSLTKLLGPTLERPHIDYADDDLITAYANFDHHINLSCDLNHLATATDGRRLSLCVYRGCRLEIWTQHQGDGHMGKYGVADWHKSRVIDQELTEVIRKLKRPSCIWSRKTSCTLFITDCYGSGSTQIAHLDGTGTLEEVTELFGEHARNRIMPMEIDWPTYFMSRLRGSY